MESWTSCTYADVEADVLAAAPRAARARLLSSFSALRIAFLARASSSSSALVSRVLGPSVSVSVEVEVAHVLGEGAVSEVHRAAAAWCGSLRSRRVRFEEEEAEDTGSAASTLVARLGSAIAPSPLLSALSIDPDASTATRSWPLRLHLIFLAALRASFSTLRRTLSAFLAARAAFLSSLLRVGSSSSSSSSSSRLRFFPCDAVATALLFSSFSSSSQSSSSSCDPLMTEPRKKPL